MYAYVLPCTYINASRLDYSHLNSYLQWNRNVTILTKCTSLTAPEVTILKILSKRNFHFCVWCCILSYVQDITWIMNIVCALLCFLLLWVNLANIIHGYFPSIGQSSYCGCATTLKTGGNNPYRCLQPVNQTKPNQNQTLNISMG